MKVKYKYNTSIVFDITTSELIRIGASDRGGQIEALEAQVEQLTNVLAALINRAGISGEELLKLTSCEYKLDVDDDA